MALAVFFHIRNRQFRDKDQLEGRLLDIFDERLHPLSVSKTSKWDWRCNAYQETTVLRAQTCPRKLTRDSPRRPPKKTTTTTTTKRNGKGAGLEMHGDWQNVLFRCLFPPSPNRTAHQGRPRKPRGLYKNISYHYPPPPPLIERHIWGGAKWNKDSGKICCSVTPLTEWHVGGDSGRHRDSGNCPRCIVSRLAIRALFRLYSLILEGFVGHYLCGSPSPPLSLLTESWSPQSEKIGKSTDNCESFPVRENYPFFLANCGNSFLAFAENFTGNVIFWLKKAGIFRPSAAVSRDRFMESCTCRCCRRREGTLLDHSIVFCAALVLCLVTKLNGGTNSEFLSDCAEHPRLLCKQLWSQLRPIALSLCRRIWFQTITTEGIQNTKLSTDSFERYSMLRSSQRNVPLWLW